MATRAGGNLHHEDEIMNEVSKAENQSMPKLVKNREIAIFGLNVCAPVAQMDRAVVS
jgi:hypothetical protein